MFMRFFLVFFIKAIIVWFYKEVDKKYTGCYLNTTELLDCALIGVYAVIRSNTVLSIFPYHLLRPFLP